jgi:hypothetical protein
MDQEPQMNLCELDRSPSSSLFGPREEYFLLDTLSKGTKGKRVSESEGRVRGLLLAESRIGGTSTIIGCIAGVISLHNVG